MDNSDALKDVRFLRDVVARTEPNRVNYYWPVTLCWGIVISIAYVVCAYLGNIGKVELIPWIWPVAMSLVGFPLSFYLSLRIKRTIQNKGVRPRMRKDLIYLWVSISLIGLLWSEAMGVAGVLPTQWWVLSFIWCSLYFVGYVMNGVLLSSEWFWAAGVMLASMIAAYLGGPDYYWLPGMWVGGTVLIAGLLGWRNARRHAARLSEVQA